MASTSIIPFILIITIIIALVLVLRRRILSLIADLVVGGVLYLGILFFIAFILGVYVPPVIADIGFPATLIGITLWHVISNLNNGGTSKNTARAMAYWR
jgi:ABC-type amino acid transport system permease subunit